MADLGKKDINGKNYMEGLRCHKKLWLSMHRKDLSSEITSRAQIGFDDAREVKLLATRYYDGGVEITNKYVDVSGAAEATQQYVKDGHDLIFKAVAIHPIDGCSARINILKRVEDSDEWDMFEAKSSTSMKDKDKYIDSMSFQYYVFHSAGYKIRKCFIMVLDNSYILDGDINPQQVFRLEDVSSKVSAKQGKINAEVERLGCALEGQAEPSTPIGAQCLSPKPECNYKAHCWAHMPEYSVYDVFKAKKAEKISREHDIVEIEKLPAHTKLSDKKKIEVQSYLSGEKYVDVSAIAEFVQQIKYPVYYLDYETFSPAIPMFNGTNPYRKIPFQFSVHIQNEPNGELIHHEFLHQERCDPRRDFAKKLVELCGDTGTVLVYNQGFEGSVNTQLAEDFPEYAEPLLAINARIVDLYKPFQKQWLYHPKQNGSESLKAVLPCFTDSSYADLEIRDADKASLEYKKFMAGAISSDDDLDTLWKNLSTYCEQDTFAMVLLLDVLNKEVSNG